MHTYTCTHQVSNHWEHSAEQKAAQDCIHIRALFNRIDFDKNGIMQQSELRRAVQNADPNLQTLLTYALGFPKDATQLERQQAVVALFANLDKDGDRCVTYEEFLRGVTKLKGTGSGFTRNKPKPVVGEEHMTPQSETLQGKAGIYSAPPPPEPHCFTYGAVLVDKDTERETSTSPATEVSPTSVDSRHRHSVFDSLQISSHLSAYKYGQVDRSNELAPVFNALADSEEPGDFEDSTVATSMADFEGQGKKRDKYDVSRSLSYGIVARAIYDCNPGADLLRFLSNQFELPSCYIKQQCVKDLLRAIFAGLFSESKVIGIDKFVVRAGCLVAVSDAS